MCHREHPRSSTGPRPRPGRPSAITGCFDQIPMLFSTFSTLLLAERVLTAIRSFQTLNPLKTLLIPTVTFYTSVHTFLSKLLASLSRCWAWFHEQPKVGPMLSLITPQHILLSLTTRNSQLKFPATIIPMHNPAASPASFRPISLTFRLSKLFEHLVLNRLCFYLESKNLISPIYAGFRLVRSIIDQVLFLSQSIWNGFKKRPPNWTVLATIDFSKAFDSVWHSALFHKLLVLGLSSCFVRWFRSFLSDRKLCPCPLPFIW